MSTQDVNVGSADAGQQDTGGTGAADVGAAGGNGAAAPWYGSISDEGTRKAVESFKDVGALAGAYATLRRAADSEDWRGAIGDEKLRKSVEKYASIEALAKGYDELNRYRGRSIAIPSDKATEEEKADFRRKLGVPDEASKYAFTVPDNTPEHMAPDDTRKEWYSKLAFNASLTPAQAQMVFEGALLEAQALEEAQTNAEEQATQEADQQLRREWPNQQEYSRNVEAAKRALKSFADAQTAEFLETHQIGGVALGDHPVFLKTFASIGRAMTESNLVAGVSEDMRANLSDQIRSVREQKAKALTEGDTREANRLSEKERELIAQRDGNAPPVGVSTRTV